MRSVLNKFIIVIVMIIAILCLCSCNNKKVYNNDMNINSKFSTQQSNENPLNAINKKKMSFKGDLWFELTKNDAENNPRLISFKNGYEIIGTGILMNFSEPVYKNSDYIKSLESVPSILGICSTDGYYFTYYNNFYVVDDKGKEIDFSKCYMYMTNKNTGKNTLIKNLDSIYIIGPNSKLNISNDVVTTHNDACIYYNNKLYQIDHMVFVTSKYFEFMGVK